MYLTLQTHQFGTIQGWNSNRTVDAFPKIKIWNKRRERILVGSHRAGFHTSIAMLREKQMRRHE